MRLLREHRLGLLAGGLAAALALEVVFLASALRHLPFAPFAFALAVVDVTPGAISSTLIDLLQFWAKALLEIGVLVFTVGAGAVGGALAAGGGARSRALLVAGIPWALDVLAALTFASRQFDGLGTTVAGAVAVGVYAVSLRWLSRPAEVPSAIGPSRRRTLVGAGALVLLLGSGGLVLASLGRRTV